MTFASATSDPCLGHLRRELEGREPRRYERDGDTKEAAVAAILRPGLSSAGNSALELLLIERTHRSDDPWSGHIALPGGRREGQDPDLLTTALRETREEVGLELVSEVDVIGPLDEVRPNTRKLPPLIIAPFVATAPADAEAVPDPREVAAAFWVPIEKLLAKEAQSEIQVSFGPGEVYFPSIRYRDHHIWGLTHRILFELFRRLGALDRLQPPM
ncbi:MAG: CoA pyrophosphatase [Acidobacteriota bacterium]